MAIKKDNLKKYKIGPHSYENWKIYERKKNPINGCEYELFSDVDFVGEIIDPLLGPYKILNPTPVNTYLPYGKVAPYKARSALILQCSNVYTVEETSDSYHGGSLADEIAALLSLLFGVRIQAGRFSREFSLIDLIGRACFIYDKPEPSLPVGTYFGIIPSLTKRCCFQPIERKMFSYPKLKSDDAVALVRAARLYQNAIWFAESDPNLAWLWLVSAVEVAATQWNSTKLDPVKQLEEFKPRIVEILKEAKDVTLIQKVSKELADLTGATKRFITFLSVHSPKNPPDNRVSEIGAQVEWTEVSLYKAFHKIYEHRSKALHTGKPFPYPMCSLPFKFSEKLEERPIGQVRQAQGHVWGADDLPMHLYIFEYIVREALIDWWREVTPRGY